MEKKIHYIGKPVSLPDSNPDSSCVKAAAVVSIVEEGAARGCGVEKADLYTRPRRGTGPKMVPEGPP